MKDNLPKTWEEFCRTIPVKKEWYIDNFSQIEYKTPTAKVCYRSEFVDKKLLPNYDTAKAFLALMQLIQLRDCYRQGWKPDWEDDLTEKYIITNEWGEPTKEYYAKSVSHILSFQNEELRDQFFENFKDLIEQAKELI